MGEPLELARGPVGVRVVAHGRPALRVERTWQPPQGDRAPAVGAHEVFIEGDDHGWTGWVPRRTLLEEHLVLLASRCRDLALDSRLRSLVWARDQGTGLAPPGSHPHGQLFGLPVPLAVLPPLKKQARLMVCEEGEARAMVAPSPRGDFEVEVQPGATPIATAAVVWRVLVALEAALEAPPVSCVWVRRVAGPDGVVRIRPWLGTPGGLDLVSLGFVTWTPEDAAAELRGALP